MAVSDVQMMDSIVRALGWALIDAAWQGILVGALYGLARLATGDARLRLAAGQLALLSLALLPVASLLWRLQASAVGTAAGEAVTSAALSQGMAAVGSAAPLDMSIDAWLPWLVAAWALGVAVHTARLIMQWRGLRRLCAQSTPVDAQWQALLQTLRLRLGVKARVRLLHGVQVATPMLVGVLRPTILLPTSLLLQLPPAQVELILIHELAHLRRLDTWFNLLQTCLDTLLFFHPAVHWISRKVREDRELCCDQLVLQRGGDPMLYARTLLAMAEAHHHAAAPELALGAAGGQLMERVQRIVDVPVVRQGTQMPAIGALLVLASLLWLLRPSADDNLLRDLGLPPMAVTGISAAVPPLAGLRFTVADVAAVIQPLAPRPALSVPEIATPVPEQVIAESSVTVPTAPLLLDAPIDAARTPLPDVAVDPVASIAVPAPATAAPAPVADTSAPSLLGESRALEQVAPEYPSDARLEAVEGFVVLRYRVDATGRARDIRVLDAQPVGSGFERAATRALAQWRFQPEFGANVEYRQLFDFRLEGSRRAAAEAEQRCSVRTGSRLCRPRP